MNAARFDQEVKQEALVIAQLTDTHLFAGAEETLRGVSTARSLQHVLDHLKTIEPQPDVVLLTGDLSQDETIASYERLQSMMADLERPVYWIRGNHDQGTAIEVGLKGDRMCAAKCFQQGNWNIVLLNSAVEGQVGGTLTPEEINWLEQQLRQYQQHPTLIAVHHPPVLIGSAGMDEINLLNAEEFFAVIDRHPQVKVVLFGHIHQEFETERQGVRYWGTPSTGIQFKPRTREFEVDDLPPGFRLLTLYSDGNYKSQVERIPLLIRKKEEHIS